MKRIAMLLGTALLLIGASVARAEEDKGNQPEPSQLEPVAAVAERPCATPCCTTGCAKRSGHFLDWLLYRPMPSHCGCHCVVSPCTPPAYLWFTDHCQGGGCHGSCGYAAAVLGPPMADNPPVGLLPEAPPRH